MDINVNYFNAIDSVIWRDFKSGCRRAYCLMYEKYSPSLYNYSRHISQDEELIKDCIQDLFIEIWINKEKLGDVISIKYYLFKSLRRKLIAEIENQKKSFKKNQSLYDQDFEIVFSHESHLIEEQKTKEEKERLLKAVNSLSKRQKEVIFLKFYSNLSYKEVASIMDLNVNSTYNVMSKAIDILKKELRKAKNYLYVH